MILTLNKRLLGEQICSLFTRPHPAPVFVFGNQKSGTSVVAGLLSAATGERLIADFAGAREPYIGRLIRGETSVADFVAANRWAFSAPIIKEPSLTFAALALLDRFPAASAVFLMRNPWDNIRSILGRLKLRGDTNVPVPTAKQRINRNWQSILDGSNLGMAPENFVSLLARRWLCAAQICERLGNRAVVLRYEDFIQHKSQSIAELAGKLHLTAANDISQLLEFPFQPRDSNTDDASAFFGPNLARITGICGAEASRFGYEVPQHADRLRAAE